ncbi:cell division protein ZapA [Jiella sp. M17.18]|uniref:cell division protein ZapA n=1 Tax=Jiella sp. M17.18 TaxID=3234247 RepID=UPI0034DEB892
MPQVVVTIDGKTYRMACAEGEEAHLEDLAADFDAKVAELRESFGQIGDLRLTVMAAIMATDQLFEARRKLRELEGRVERGAPAPTGDGREREALAESLNEAAASIERLAQRLANGG